jgi:hypothetical protein
VIQDYGFKNGRTQYDTQVCSPVIPTCSEAGVQQEENWVYEGLSLAWFIKWSELRTYAREK